MDGGRQRREFPALFAVAKSFPNRRDRASAGKHAGAVMLERIIAADVLGVVFQPIRRLGSGRVVAYEVLGRMLEPVDDVPALGPAELVELAVIENRLFDLERAWRHAAIRRIAEVALDSATRFFVNVDTRIVKDPRFRRGTTLALLEHYGLAPERFVFELGERDPELGSRRIAELLEHYATQGFDAALDDLGTGYASLHALVSLRPRIAKLDRVLVAGIARDPLRRDLVGALAGFATKSGIELVAECIETADDRDTLLALGVPLGQGYLLGRPAPELIGQESGPGPVAGARHLTLVHSA